MPLVDVRRPIYLIVDLHSGEFFERGVISNGLRALGKWQSGCLGPASSRRPERRRAVVTKLNGALRGVIDSPDTQTKFKNVGFEGFSSTPEELGAFIKVQLGVWGR